MNLIQFFFNMKNWQLLLIITTQPWLSTFIKIKKTVKY